MELEGNGHSVIETLSPKCFWQDEENHGNLQEAGVCGEIRTKYLPTHTSELVVKSEAFLWIGHLYCV
jgi:hypothetical protein